MNAARLPQALLLLIAAVPIAKLPAQRAVPIRELGPVEVKSVAPFRSVLDVRALSTGALLVNDGTGRQLVLLNKDLLLERVLLDTLATDGRSYGPRSSPMIKYLGDSTLFVDGSALTLLVLDASGKVARVMSAPNARDLRMLASGASATRS